MGLFDWLFPSPEKRMDTARKHLEAERWAQAREEVLGLEQPEALALLATAERGLSRLNLDAARSWAQAGDEARVAIHLELAENFHDGSLREEFRVARKEIRELRAQRKAEAKRAHEEREARLLAVDPLGALGGRSLVDPEVEVNDGEDADELAARLALIVDAYPETLRPAVAKLGADFARAVLDFENGRPDLALQGLLALPDTEPLVLYERARCAMTLGDPKAAARTLRRFAQVAGGHHAVGANHTAVMLAQAEAEAGDVHAALRVLREARSIQPDVGGVLYAQLLEATDELAEADRVLVDLVRKHSRTDALYKLLARVRVKGGERAAAIKALESSFAHHCSTPGKCGYKAPDPELLRMLATLHLEEGADVPRGLEVAQQAMGLLSGQSWEDHYLRALVARAEGAPEAASLADRMLEQIPDGDPRRARLEQHLGA